jgi:hypothetical protein
MDSLTMNDSLAKMLAFASSKDAGKIAGTSSYHHIEPSRSDGVLLVEDTIYQATFFLYDGYTIPVKWERGKTYNENNLVIYDELIFKCMCVTNIIPSGEHVEWEIFTSSREWRDRWNKYFTYSPGEIVYAHDTIYECICDDCPPSAHPAYEGCRFWKCIGELGREFPPWMPSPQAVTVDINMGVELLISPSTGASMWEVSPEKFIGQELANASDQHVSIRKMCVDSRQTQIVQFYTIKTIHCGYLTMPVTDDNPKPTLERFIGINFGAYYIPPHVTADNMKALEDILPMVNPSDGTTFSNVFMQWRAADCPFIAQGDGRLGVFNREPHPHYTKLFANVSSEAIKSNLVDTSDNAFKLSIFDSVISTSELPTSSMTSALYGDWRAKQSNIKITHFKNAHMMWEKSTTIWCTWLRKLRETSMGFGAIVQSIGQDIIGIDVWINLSDTAIRSKYKNIKGLDGTVLEDVAQRTDNLLNLWADWENGCAGYNTSIIICIESLNVEVRKMLKEFSIKSKTRKSHSRKNKKSNSRK